MFVSRVNVMGVLGASVRRMASVGLLCLLAAALLSACGDEPTATPPPVPPTPTATPVPPTATPTPLPATPTPEVGGPAVADLDIDADTRWGTLFDALTTSEQSCISDTLGDELASVLERRVMAEGDTERSDALLFGCLDPATAVGVFLSVFVAQTPELTEDAAGCLAELLANTDVAGIVASTLPDASLDAVTAALGFGLGLLSCVPELAFPGGVGPSGPPIDDEALLWRYAAGGRVVNAPTVVDGVVYTGSDDHHVYALDSSTGELRWSFETGGVIRSTPTVTGAAVYVGSNDNHVYAMDAETGELLWRYDTGGWAQYSPTVSGGMVYLGASGEGGHRVHALDAASGERTWIAETPYSVTPELTPTVVGGKVYAPGDLGQFHVLDASTGNVAWSFETGIGGEAPPTVIEGVVYLTGVNAAYALDESTGELVWSYDTERLPAREFPAVIADGVYYFSPDDHIYALSTTTGEPRWSYQADSMINTAPVAAEGMVYAGSESGRFYALDAVTGELVWSRESMEWGLQSPAVVDGVLYAESSDGHLRALDAATGEDLWQFQKGYFAGVPSFTVDDGVLYVGALDGGVYAFTAPVRTTEAMRVLRLLYWQAPSLPSPYLSSGNKDTDAAALTLEPLAKYDPDGNLVPALAAEIPTLENGGFAEDLTSITWTLKEGLKWSDGSDMTAEDVVFTWRYCADEDTGCTNESSFDGVASVQAVDSRTVKIAFDAPTPYPYNAFVGAGTPVISRAQFADCVGVAATTCEEQNTAPLGGGPYRIIYFEPNERAVYERNPFYYGEEPYFDRVVLVGGGDAASAASAVLERGRSRLRVEPAGGTGDACLDGSGRAGQTGRLLHQSGGTHRRQPDQCGPCLGGRPLRVSGRRESSPLPHVQAHPASHVDGYRSRPHNSALRLCGEANVQPGHGPSELRFDRKRRVPVPGHRSSQQPAGRQRRPQRRRRRCPRVQRRSSPNRLPDFDQPIREETQALVRDWWRQIGIETELKQHDASVFFGGDPVVDKEASFRRFFADVQMYADGPGIDPQQALSGPLCKHIQTRDNNWAFGNVARSCNLEYDALFAQLEQIRVGPDREALVKRLNDIYIQGYYEIPLVERGFVSARLNTLQGVRINGWDSELWNIAEWRR